VAVHYGIQESDDALEILVRNEISLFLRVVCGGFAGWLVWFIIGTHLPGVRRSVLAIVVAVCVVALFRQMTARLMVTEVQLQAGRLSLPTAKVYRLEFQEHESGGQGLYAVTMTGEPVLLPHIDATQTREIIAAIKKKFPGLAEAWGKSEAAAVRPAG
jgi:Protein of unknown function (DUF3093)